MKTIHQRRRRQATIRHVYRSFVDQSWMEKKGTTTRRRQERRKRMMTDSFSFSPFFSLPSRTENERQQVCATLTRLSDRRQAQRQRWTGVIKTERERGRVEQDLCCAEFARKRHTLIICLWIRWRYRSLSLSRSMAEGDQPVSTHRSYDDPMQQGLCRQQSMSNDRDLLFRESVDERRRTG